MIIPRSLFSPVNSLQHWSPILCPLAYLTAPVYICQVWWHVLKSLPPEDRTKLTHKHQYPHLSSEIPAISAWLQTCTCCTWNYLHHSNAHWLSKLKVLYGISFSVNCTHWTLWEWCLPGQLSISGALAALPWPVRPEPSHWVLEILGKHSTKGRHVARCHGKHTGWRGCWANTNPPLFS